MLSSEEEKKILNKLNELGYKLAKIVNHNFSKIFYDTQGGKLFRQNLSLCKRGNLLWQVFKSSALEIEERSAHDIDIPERTRAFISSLVNQDRLLPLLHLRCRESNVHIQKDDQLLKIVIQRILFIHPFNKRQSYSINILFIDASDSVVEAQYLASLMRDYLLLKSLDFDYVKTGLYALNLPLPGAPVPKEYIVTKDDSLISACEKILLKQAYKMWANTDGTLKNLDPEFLHDLRVATRRGRFALRLIAKILKIEKCNTMRAELGWIGGLLGSVRDLDVFIVSLKSQMREADIEDETASNIIAIVSKDLVLKRKKLVSALKSARYREIISDLKAFFKNTEIEIFLHEKKMQPALEIVPQLIKSASKKIYKKSDKNASEFSDSDLHKLRIDFKKLRYTSEFFYDILDEKMKILIKTFIEIQDLLGAHQDSVVAISNLEKIAGELDGKSTSSKKILISIGALILLNRQIMKAARDRFDALWKKIPRIKNDIDELKIRQEQ